MEKKSKGLRIAIIVFIILIVGALAGLAAYVIHLYADKNDGNSTNETFANVAQEEIIQNKMFKGTDRPIAVMIDNNKLAMPHAGLSNAYMVYEAIVEGGESRLMALFKGVDLDKIGPVRSSRHYFLDYALENDAIYVHFGWSPQAEYDIPHLGVNNINGVEGQAGKAFWRVKDKSAPHNAVTSTAKIKEMAQQKGYRTTSDVSSVFEYAKKEVELDSETGADKITIPFSKSNIVKWEYDAETKRYTRYCKNTKEVEWDTKEPVTFKNIIIEFAKNTTLNDGENKDRQTLDNIKTLDGYYITNGKAIKIKCSKASRASQTEYRDLDGKEIEVTDDNIFVEICPIDAKVSIEDIPDSTDESNTTNTVVNN